MSTLAGLALLAAMGIPGVALLRSLRSKLDPLEQAVYGFPLGLVASSLALLAAASAAGALGWELVGLTGLVSLAFGAIIWRSASMPPSEWR